MKFLIVVLFAFLCSLSFSKQKECYCSSNLKIQLEKIPQSAKFINDSLSIWCGSLIKGDDGLFHMYYSIWPKRLGWAWVTNSLVAHAVSKSQYGPFEYKDIALPRRGVGYWDGLCTHNPTIHKFGNKYYLYYTGNTGDDVNPNGENKAIEKLNWVHRNNQRIGVAVADNPNGPWIRFDKPIIEVSPDSLAWDALCVANPAITQGPDGKYILVYKAVGKKIKMPSGGPVVHLVAVSDSPTGPFVKQGKPIFIREGSDFPSEDSYIWYQDGKYRAIVKDIGNKENKHLVSLVHYDSVNGLDWRPATNFLISDRTVEWASGRRQQLRHLERPQLYFENDIPVTLLCAGDTLDEKGVRQSFNVQIPIQVTVYK